MTPKKSSSPGSGAALVRHRSGETSGATAPSAEKDTSDAGLTLSATSVLFPIDARFASTRELLRVTEWIGAAHFAGLPLD
jgi:hypothetical protein